MRYVLAAFIYLSIGFFCAFDFTFWSMKHCDMTDERRDIAGAELAIFWLPMVVGAGIYGVIGSDYERVCTR